MLVDLTQVTQDNLLDVKGSLRALWATAQQINARQKFELSIRCVFFIIYALKLWHKSNLLAKASRASPILII